MEALRKLWQLFTDALIPPRTTEALVRTLTVEELVRLRRPHYAQGIEALLPYEDSRVSALIWELKYYDSTRAAQLASVLLGAEMADITSEELTHAPLLIPVPLHPKREKARGYNQTHRVTARMSEQGAAVEHRPEVLVRVKDTPRQTALSRTKRLVNMKDAFEVCDSSAVAGRVCILVDDVVTTGSTLRTAGAALLNAGASKVILVALAHAG